MLTDEATTDEGLAHIREPRGNAVTSVSVSQAQESDHANGDPHRIPPQQGHTRDQRQGNREHEYRRDNCGTRFDDRISRNRDSGRRSRSRSNGRSNIPDRTTNQVSDQVVETSEGFVTPASTPYSKKCECSQEDVAKSMAAFPGAPPGQACPRCTGRIGVMHEADKAADVLPGANLEMQQETAVAPEDDRNHFRDVNQFLTYLMSTQGACGYTLSTHISNNT